MPSFLKKPLPSVLERIIGVDSSDLKSWLFKNTFSLMSQRGRKYPMYEGNLICQVAVWHQQSVRWAVLGSSGQSTKESESVVDKENSENYQIL